jgi:hypothetical protein
MNARTRSKRIWGMIVLAAWAALPYGFLVRPADAQGCAMCYQSASASGAQGIAALRHGILILLLPAVSLFLGIFVFIYRRRDLPR